MPIGTCSITEYIEEKNPDLCRVVRVLCVDHRLMTSKSHSGPTFIYPNAKMTEEILKNNREGNFDKADAMLSSLIIYGYYPTPSSFENGPVGNKRGLTLPAVEKATAKSVKFVGGLDLSVADDFVAHRGAQIAIYTMSAGSAYPPCEEGSAPPFVLTPGMHKRAPPPETRKKGHGEKRGGYTIGSPDNLSEFPTSVEEEYISRLRACKSRSENFKCPYLEYVVSFMNFLRFYDHQKYVGLIPLISYCPIESFYIVFEPYMPESNRMIPTHVIALWGYSRDLCVNPIEEFRMYGSTESNPYKMRNSDILAALKVARETSKDLDNIPGTRDTILRYYKYLFRDPKAFADIRGKMLQYNNINLILPDETVKLFSADPTAAAIKKLWQDDLRVFVRMSCRTNTSLVDAECLGKVTANIKTYRPGINFERECTIIDPEACKSYDRFWFETARCFIASTLFLYVRMRPDAYARDKSYASKPLRGNYDALFDAESCCEASLWLTRYEERPDDGALAKAKFFENVHKIREEISRSRGN